MPLFSSKAVLMGAGGNTPSEGGSWVRYFKLNDVQALSNESFTAKGACGAGRDTFSVVGYSAMNILYFNNVASPADVYSQLIVFDSDMEISHEKFYSNYVDSHINGAGTPVIRNNGNIVISKFNSGASRFEHEEYAADTFNLVTDKGYDSWMFTHGMSNGGMVSTVYSSTFDALKVGFVNAGLVDPISYEWVDGLAADAGADQYALHFTGQYQSFDYKLDKVYMGMGNTEGSKADQGYSVGAVDIIAGTGEAYLKSDSALNIVPPKPITLGNDKWLVQTLLGWIICSNGHPTHLLTGSPFQLTANPLRHSVCLHPTLNRCWIASHPTDINLNNYIGYLDNDLSWGEWSKITVDGVDGIIDGIETLPDGSVYLVLTFVGICLLYRYQYSSTTLSVVIDGHTIAQTPQSNPATISQGAVEVWTLSDSTSATLTVSAVTPSAFGVAGSDFVTEFDAERVI